MKNLQTKEEILVHQQKVITILNQCSSIFSDELIKILYSQQIDSSNMQFIQNRIMEEFNNAVYPALDFLANEK